MNNHAFRVLICSMMVSVLLFSSLWSFGANNTISDKTQTDENTEEISPFIPEISLMLESQEVEGIPQSQDNVLDQKDLSEIYPSNTFDEVDMDFVEMDSPYWKIEPALLSKSKTFDYLQVIITATDMNEVRDFLGQKTHMNPPTQKRNANRLETSIMDIQGTMLLKIAFLESVISIQSYSLPTPPQLPIEMEDLGELDSETQPTMLNAVKYHGADTAWSLGFNGSGINVAVIDTGVDFGHPDLNGTQARVENPSSPYYGWPIAFDSRSMNRYLSSGGQAFPSRDVWYSDTSTTDSDGNGNGTLDSSGHNVTGIISQSGIYHLGQHPDNTLSFKLGNYGNVLVVDENSPGVYDTVYVDLDNDNNFTDEKACRKGDEASFHDMGGDGIPDRSGGMIYFIADGTNPVPYADVIAAENGYSLPIPSTGNLVAFMINDIWEAGGNHGTLCASAIAGQGVISGGKVTGTAPNSKIIAVGNRYQGGNNLDNYYFAVEGYDGIPGTGDEAQIVSCSFGDSNVIHGGWDFTSRFVDNLTTYYAPNVTFAVASGNGGYGYGTVVSPGSSPGVVTVGAAYNKPEKDVVYWSNRGPNALGQVDPDIVSVGVSAYGDQPLNQKNNGNNAYQLWSGTSLATPVTAGIIALIYDSYFQSNSGYPSSELTREILMSTADNLNYDPLVQGAGFSNATRATKVANKISGLSLSPSFWTAGNYRGADYDAFVHILHPGESDNLTISISNANQSVGTTAFMSDYVLSIAESYFTAIEANKSMENTSNNAQPDFIIPLNDTKNGISRIPNDTALLKVSALMPYDEFDPNRNYFQDNTFSITVYNWVDSNSNGSYWNDTNSDGVAQPEEIESNELKSIYSSPLTATTQEVRIHDPHSRIDDGLLVGIFHRPTGGLAPEITHFYVQSQCYNRTDWSWLTTNTTTLGIGAGGTSTFNASLTVPLNAPIGIFEGMIAVNDTMNESVLPVIVNVAGNSTKFQFGGNTMSSDLYANDQVFGAFRWGWRYEGGDWRFYFTDIPDSFATEPGTKILADVQWDNVPTDIDVFILGGILDSYSSEIPDRYGPYTMEIKSASNDAHRGSGKFEFDTSTGGPEEIITADLSPGLNEIILHNVLHAGLPFDNVTGEIGTINVTPYPWDIGFINRTDNLTGTQMFTVLSSLNLSGILVDAYGVFPSMEYPNQLIYQNDPDDKTTSNWSREFDVSGAEYIKVNISSKYSIDIDLFLLRDDGDGIPEWGSEQVGSSTSPYAEEEIILNNPTDGKYWVFVHGWSITPDPSIFDCYIEAVYGSDISVADVPVGPITGDDAVHFNASYSLPPKGGEYRGVVVIGTSEAPTMIRVPFKAELESDVPIIWNLTPSHGSWITNSQPEISANYSDSGSGINTSMVFIYIDGINQTSIAAITASQIILNPTLPLSEGWHTVNLTVTDFFGNQNSTSWQFLVDTKKPKIWNLKPQDGSMVNSSKPQISAQYNDSGSGVNISMVFIYINGLNQTGNATINSDSITLIPPLPITEAVNMVYLIVTDLFGYQNSTTWQFNVDTIKPVIYNLQPPNGTWINTSQPEIRAQYLDTNSGIMLSGIFIHVDGVNRTTLAIRTLTYVSYTPLSPLSEGLHTVNLSVTDMLGNMNSTSWQFLVDSVSPIANAGPDKIIYEDENVFFNGSASSDENGLYNYTWDLGDGDFGYGVSPEHIYIKSGTYIVTLTLWDIVNNSASDTLKVFVNNLAPNAEAGNDIIMNEGDTAYFNGNGSSDTASDISTMIYTWYLEDGAVLSGMNASYIFMDDGIYVVTLIVQDNDGYTDSDILNVTVINLPPIAYAGGPYSGEEGENIIFLGSASDPGDDTFTYEWDFNDSDGITYTDATGPNPSWTWSDDFSGTIYLKVTDDDGGIGLSSAAVTINNVAPTADSGGPYTGDEGSSITLSGSTTDPGSDTFTFEWDLDFDGFYDDAVGQNPSWTYNDNGFYIIVLRISDDDGDFAQDTTTVTVNNVAPTADAGGPYMGDEGALVSFTSSVTDPGILDTFSYSWDFGDESGTSQENPTHIYKDNGIYTLTLTVTDNDGGTHSDSTTITVNNIAPTANAGTAYIGNEGSPITFSGSAEDPGNDTFTYEWDFDDSDGITYSDSTGLNPSWTWIDDFIGVIYLRVTDDDGGVGLDSATIAIYNVAPSADSGGPYSGNEGTSVTFTGSATDPGSDTFNFEWDLDNDGLYNDGIGQGISWSWNDNGVYIIKLRVTDDDNGVGLHTTTVTISNVAPSADAGGPYSGNESSEISFTGSYTDPGMDSFTYQWNFGDGKISTQQNPVHVYYDNGIYTITFTVMDDDGGVDTKETMAIIYNLPPEIEPIEGVMDAKENQAFYIRINASDAKGDDITFSDNSDLFEIDPVSGVIQFTPKNIDVGIREVIITASDDEATSTQILLINISNENQPPMFEQIGPQIATEGKQYSFTVHASDEDEDDILHFFDDSELFVIDQNTGEISFTPTNDQVGIYLVTITVMDNEGASDHENLTFTVLNTNDEPQLDSILDQQGKVGERFSFKAHASDIDDEVLIFSDDSDLFAIDPTTGIISFIPEKEDVGVHIIGITVQDISGANHTQTMVLEIEDIQITPEPEPKQEVESETDWMPFILLIIILLAILVILLFIHMLMHRNVKDTKEFGVVDEKAPRDASKETEFDNSEIEAEELEFEEDIVEKEVSENQAPPTPPPFPPPPQ